MISLARFAWFPVAAFALAIAILWVANPRESYESGLTLFALNWTFTTLVSLFIAVLAGRSFLAGGQPGLLMLCCAMIVWGFSTAIAVTGNQVGNYNITIHNLGMLLSASLHFAGARLATQSKPVAEPGGMLALGSTGALVAVGLIWMATLEGWLPVFFVQGQGGTPVREIVLFLSGAMFGLTASWIWMWRLQRQTTSEFLRWYALGLALLSIGVLGLALQTVTGSLLSWTARSALYLGGLYMLIGALFAMRESRAWKLPLTVALEQAQDALIERARLLDLTHDAILVRDKADRIVYWNRGAQAMYGWGLDEALGKDPHHLFRTVFPKPLEEIMAIVRRDGRWTGELTHTTKDGSQIHVESRWVLDHGAKDSQNSILEVNTDITERKVAEEALRQADRRKNEFLAMLAHELRNPLAPIRNSLEIMKRARGDSRFIEQARATIDRQISQMVRLVDDLLDVSRITRGRIELRKERIELATAVQSAVETSRPLIESNSQVLTVHLPSKPIFVEADPIRLAQVFANLLNNAAKYSNRGGTIRLTVEHRNGVAAVSVKDNGIGIPASMQSGIFHLFTQVDQSLERSKGGLGIGLTLVKWLVELHGGSVEIRSEVGRGSEFIVRLPLVLSLAATHEDVEVGGATYSPPHRILVADDNADAAATLATLLQIMGNEFRTAHDGLEAIEVASSFRPQVIFMDIGMPKLNGYDACRRIRQQPWGKDMVLVALSGWGHEEDRSKSKEAGFDDHLTKPSDVATLEKFLSSVSARSFPPPHASDGFSPAS